MKKTLLILFLAATSLTACKKDKEKTLEGRWDVTKIDEWNTLNGQKESETHDTYATGEFYFIFKGNTYTKYEDGYLEDEGTFTMNGDNSLITTNNEGVTTFTLQWNGENDVVLNLEETNTINSQVYGYKGMFTMKRN